MRVHYVLLLAASAFFASTEADVVATDSAPGASTADRLPIEEKNAVSVSRSLRTAALNVELDARFIELVLNGSTKVRKPLQSGPIFRKWLQHMSTVKKKASAAAAAAHALLIRTGRPIEELYNALKQTETDIVAEGIAPNARVLDIAKKVRQILVRQLVSEKFSTRNLENGLSELQRQNPYWISESDAIYSALKEELKYEKTTSLIESGLKKADTKEFAKKLQRIQFDDWVGMGVGLKGALKKYGHQDGVALVKAEQDFLLRYFDHLIEMKNRIPATRLKQLLDYPALFTELVAGQAPFGITILGKGFLIVRWVKMGFDPKDVSWVLGKKSLEEGTQEYIFMEGYKTAFYVRYPKPPTTTTSRAP